METSFNCSVLSNTFNILDTFSVNIYNNNNKIFITLGKNRYDFGNFKVDHLKDYICNRKNVADSDKHAVKLWKINVKKNEIKDNVSTENDIIQNLHGKEMEPEELFQGYFETELDNQTACEFVVNNIHIITTIPAATGPSQQGVPQGPNWNDASSIYDWIQQFTLHRGRNRVCNTYGRNFEFFQRDDTIDVLWNGLKFPSLGGIVARFENRNISDKGLHPIPVLAGGPGVGKSRFLDEVERLLERNANDSDNEDIRRAFSNMVVINITYGNGCPAENLDITIGAQTIGNESIINAQTSLALRILYEYFGPRPVVGEFGFSSFRSLCNNSKVFDLTLDTTLRVIYADVIIQKNQEINSNPPLVLVLGIDEFNKLHDIKVDVCRNLIKSIGGIMCKSPENIFFIPILAGTIEGPLNQYISGSMHDPLPLPLRLLEVDDAIEIGKAMNLFDDQYVRCHPYFRMSISDIGGHVRTLEFFYEYFARELDNRKSKLNEIKMVNIMDNVKHSVKHKYRLDIRSKWLIEPLAKAILGLPVNKMDTIEFNDKLMNYQDLSSMGVLNLVPIKKGKQNIICYNVRLPYIWVYLLVQHSGRPEMDYWKSMIDYDEPMYWQNFERFNAKFWALRLSLFRLLGHQKIKLEVLLKGTKFSRRFPNVEVSLPKNLKLRKLRHRYPGVGDKKEDNEMDDDDNTEDDKMDDDDNKEDDEMDDDDDKEDDEMGDDDTEGVDDDYTKMDYPYSDIRKNISYTFLNADGAVWDVFGFLKITNDKILCIAQQVKLTSVDVNEPMIINQTLFDKEHTKVTEAMMCVPAEKWVLLFLTNVDTRNLSIKTNENSALVSKNEFLEFYGYTYASRAQFASANEKIYINSTDEDSLKILGFNKKERRMICKERNGSYLINYDDLKTRIHISDEKFRRLKRDDRIIF